MSEEIPKVPCPSCGNDSDFTILIPWYDSGKQRITRLECTCGQPFNCHKSTSKIWTNPPPERASTTRQLKPSLSEPTLADGQKINTRYVGKAGEYRVLSELLFLGYDANHKAVDEGVDIMVIINHKYFAIQVKTCNEQKGKYVASIRKTSFNRFKAADTFYVLVLRDSNKNTKFLVLPHNEIERNIHEKNIPRGNDYYVITCRVDDGGIFIGNSNMSYYLDRWDQIR